MAKKKAAKKTAGAVKVVKGRGKRGGINKSQVIRDYMNENPSAGPTEVCAALAKKGIKVTPPQVSNVKSAAAKKSGAKPMRRKKAGRPAKVGASSDKVSVADLVQTHQFVDKVGGVGAAKELIAALEKLSK